MKTNGFKARIQAILCPPNIRSDPRVKDAFQFKDETEAVGDAEYGWVYDYARETYSRAAETRDALDAKAGEIIKYLGGGAGLFTLAALFNVAPAKEYVLLWAMPSFGMTIAALGFAILARKPNELTLPPNAKDAKSFADKFKTEREAQAAFIGQWHLAHQGMKVVNERMARRVDLSFRCFFGAVALLILPVLAILIR